MSLAAKPVQNFQSAAQRFLSLLVGAKPEVKQSKIAKAGRQVRMRLIAVELLADFQCSLHQRFRFLKGVAIEQ